MIIKYHKEIVETVGKVDHFSCKNAVLTQKKCFPAHNSLLLIKVFQNCLL
jgi:hypothetical protein